MGLSAGGDLYAGDGPYLWSLSCVQFFKYHKSTITYSRKILFESESNSEVGSSNSSSSSSLSVSSIIWNSIFGKSILYSSMALMLIRASSLPSKLLDKPHFLNYCLIRSFCFFTRSHAWPTHFVVKTRLSSAVSFPSTYNSRFVSKCCLKNSSV